MHTRQGSECPDGSAHPISGIWYWWWSCTHLTRLCSDGAADVVHMKKNKGLELLFFVQSVNYDVKNQKSKAQLPAVFLWPVHCSWEWIFVQALKFCTITNMSIDWIRSVLLGCCITVTTSADLTGAVDSASNSSIGVVSRTMGSRSVPGSLWRVWLTSCGRDHEADPGLWRPHQTWAGHCAFGQNQQQHGKCACTLLIETEILARN